jgi:hypothetical protein
MSNEFQAPEPREFFEGRRAAAEQFTSAVADIRTHSSERASAVRWVAAFSAAGTLTSIGYLRTGTAMLLDAYGPILSIVCFVVSILAAVLYVVHHDLRMSAILGEVNEIVRDASNREAAMRFATLRLERAVRDKQGKVIENTKTELEALMRLDDEARSTAFSTLIQRLPARFESAQIALSVGGFLGGILALAGDAVLHLQ